jgi:hypothetical protein
LVDWLPEDEEVEEADAVEDVEELEAEVEDDGEEALSICNCVMAVERAVES